MSPEDLRQLAHMLETDLGVVAICESLEAGRDPFETFHALAERVQGASLRAQDLRALSTALAALASTQERNAALLRKAHEGTTTNEEPYGADHRAGVVEFPRA